MLPPLIVPSNTTMRSVMPSATVYQEEESIVNVPESHWYTVIWARNEPELGTAVGMANSKDR